MPTATAYTRDPRALGGPIAGLSFIAGIGAAMATATSPYPRPGSPPERVREYFNGSSTAARLSAGGQLISSAALIPFTASVACVAGQSHSGARTLRAAVIGAGGLAAATQAMSALSSAALTRERHDLATVRSLHTLAFLSDGPVHGAALGVLASDLGIAGRRSGHLSSRLSAASPAVAPLGILSPLSLAAKPMMPIIPIGRFSALLVCGIAGVRLSG